MFRKFLRIIKEIFFFQSEYDDSYTKEIKAIKKTVSTTLKKPIKPVVTGKHERVGDYCNTCGKHILDCPYHKSSFK